MAEEKLTREKKKKSARNLVSNVEWSPIKDKTAYSSLDEH